MTRTTKVARDELPYALRFDVLARDGFQCQACSATPGNAGLHVDHLLPWSLGGSHDPENLTTLCSPCNRGKGARMWLPAKMLEAYDADGFAVWRRFGTWEVQVCDRGVIAAWKPDGEYTWIAGERCHELDWVSHFATKVAHRGCDGDCPARRVPVPVVKCPPSIGAILTLPLVRLCDISDDDSDAAGHQFGDLDKTLDFLRRIHRKEHQ